MVREVTKNRWSVREFLCGDGRIFSAALHQSGFVARRKPLLSKRYITVHSEFAKRHLKDSQTMRNKILWSDETKIECQASCLEETWHHLYGEAWGWQHDVVGMIFCARDWETSQD